MNSNMNKKAQDNENFESLDEAEMVAVESITLLMGGLNRQTKTTNKMSEGQQYREEKNLRRRNTVETQPSYIKDLVTKNNMIPWNRHERLRDYCPPRGEKMYSRLTKSASTNSSGHFHRENSYKQMKTSQTGPKMPFNHYKDIGRVSLRNSYRPISNSQIDQTFSSDISTNFEIKRDPINVLREKIELLLASNAESNGHLNKYENNIMCDFIDGLNDTLLKKQQNKVNKTVSGSKKELHLESEHTRRDAINMGIDILSRLLPIESNKSKMMVIFNSIFHLMELKIENSKLKKKMNHK